MEHFYLVVTCHRQWLWYLEYPNHLKECSEGYWGSFKTNLSE